MCKGKRNVESIDTVHMLKTSGQTKQNSPRIKWQITMSWLSFLGGLKIVDPVPNWILIQQLCGSGSKLDPYSATLWILICIPNTVQDQERHR